MDQAWPRGARRCRLPLGMSLEGQAKTACSHFFPRNGWRLHGGLAQVREDKVAGGRVCIADLAWTSTPCWSVEP